MIVVMNKTTLGSNDGFTTTEFQEGKSYKVPSEMSDYLAKGFLQRGLCKIKGPVKLETKVTEPKEVKKTNRRKTNKK